MRCIAIFGWNCRYLHTNCGKGVKVHWASNAAGPEDECCDREMTLTSSSELCCSAAWKAKRQRVSEEQLNTGLYIKIIGGGGVGGGVALKSRANGVFIWWCWRIGVKFIHLSWVLEPKLRCGGESSAATRCSGTSQTMSNGRRRYCFQIETL